METSLHRQLKSLYADDPQQVEVRWGDYRIDAVARDWLIEIQHGSLAAIRDKVQDLLRDHRVLVVKPIVATKQLIKRKRKDGAVVSRRRSPRRGSLLDLFDELVYFTRVFPHPNLAVEAVLVDVEEWRYPGHGRRRYRRASDFQVEDQKLVEVRQKCRLAEAADLWKLLPRCRLKCPFHTGDLARGLNTNRGIAQRIAYVMRKTAAVRQVGKRGNALLYSYP
ncbi:MAG: hypothetical protein GTO03_17025 [Planctomycetales bacterium]|nr:hypothetical protein [Planctomycetales bacterium]